MQNRSMPSPASPLAPLSIHRPPDAVPAISPVATRAHSLPFTELTWENFERLCHRLTALEGGIEHCARYGRQGEAQEGIDIYARQPDGRYVCVQAKRHRAFTAAMVRKAVALFLKGAWASRASQFAIVVQASLRSTKVQDEVERQAALLSKQGIVFVALDGDDLTDRLRNHSKLVDDFFGRPWVKAVFGEEAAEALGKRLDGSEFARVRLQLARVYEAQFHFFDPGSFGSIGDEDNRPALTLIERFLAPDMLVRESARPSDRQTPPSPDAVGVGGRDSPSAIGLSTDDGRQSTFAPGARMRRLALEEWLSDAQRLVVLGEAGCGKSTLLRVVALDLLHGQIHFPELAQRWGEHIPVYVPFARWSSQVQRDGNSMGLKEIVRRSLEQVLTQPISDLLDRAIDERRVLLLIDGLDEWSSEHAARATLSTLVTSVDAHDIPVIVSGRPRGLGRIGTLPASWKRGTVAPLAPGQQAAIASRWFDRYAASQGTGGLSDGKLRTLRFRAELARDNNLSALAAVPLLLIGLVTLALRGQTLPRTQGDIYDQLVRVLLEVHPDSRATAAGDTDSRFRHATDPEQRRSAIACLAFSIRNEAGGAGMPHLAARNILRAFLGSPQHSYLDVGAAAAAAEEILSVNAETQGLIVEKSPGEVGFVHASFEEFLSAQHIGGWPFNEIEDFVRAHARESRWRNVITNLLSYYVRRRDEFDRLVAIVQASTGDEVAQFNHQALLGDIAFSGSKEAAATAKRLAISTMDRVETDDRFPARRDALASTLRGLQDPAVKAEVEQRLRRWLPAREKYRASLIVAFGHWSPTNQLQDTLFKAMHDEDANARRAAAAAFAKAFSSSTQAYEDVIAALTRSRDLGAAAAMLEALALGWPKLPESLTLFQEAWRSRHPEMRLVGALGLAENGTTTAEVREFVVRAQGYRADISFAHRELAFKMLLRFWANDDQLLETARQRASGGFGSPWEYDTAIAYVMSAPVDDPKVRVWLLHELKKDHASFSMIGHGTVWSDIGRFAASNDDVRVAANAYWLDHAHRLAFLHTLRHYVVHVRDPRIADVLVGLVALKKKGLDRYWALRTLLEGWGRDHPDVAHTIDELYLEPDEELEDVVSLFAEIAPDHAHARARLIELGKRPSVRRDFLASGLEACGCTAADDEAVQAIFSGVIREQDLRNAAYPLFRAFGAHARVRDLARRGISEGSMPLEAIALGYVNDPELTSRLFDAAVPLPVDLRTQIVELASNGATGTMLETVLSQAMVEADPELRVRMVIASSKTLSAQAREDARTAFVSKAQAVGPDYTSVRAAALAGLATLGALNDLSELKEGSNPITLSTGTFGEDIPSIERLFCERFADFDATFGATLAQRLKAMGNDHRLAELLSASPSASPAARRAFLELAEQGGLPLTAQALQALASERPRSELLLAHCWRVLGASDGRNDQAMTNGAVGLILRENFGDRAHVRDRLVELFGQSQDAKTAMTLAVFEPGDLALPVHENFADLGRDFADWAVAVQIATARTDASHFCRLLEAMVTRSWHSQFDAQEISNRAVQERLQRDTELEALMVERLEAGIHPSISGSFARYLASAGRLSQEARTKALRLLAAFGKDQRLPVAAYDALSHQWRAVRATLLDAATAELEVG